MQEAPPATAGKPVRWWQNGKVIVLLLIFLPPIGLILIWTSSSWTRPRKWTATALGAVWFVACASGSTAPPAQNQPGAGIQALPSAVGRPLNEAKQTALSAGYVPVSHDASDGNAAQLDDTNWVVCFQSASGSSVDFGVVYAGTPCPLRDGEPIPWPKIPNVEHWKFADAQAKLTELGASSVDARAAYVDLPPPGNPNDWIVCFQDPAAGGEAKRPFYASLSLVSPGAACPLQLGTFLNPPAPPAPPTDVWSTPTTSNDSPTTSNDTDNSDQERSGGSGYYANCAAARAAGAAPLHAGEPGYRSALDRDHDGVACE